MDWIGLEGSDELFSIEQRGGWDKIKMQIESGAVDTVGPPEVGKAFKLRETKAAKEGINYVAASGASIKYYGERVIEGETENGTTVTMPIQIADVKRALMSVHQLNQAGLKVT